LFTNILPAVATEDEESESEDRDGMRIHVCVVDFLTPKQLEKGHQERAANIIVLVGKQLEVAATLCDAE